VGKKGSKKPPKAAPPRAVEVTIAVGVNHEGRVAASLIAPQRHSKEDAGKLRQLALDDVKNDLCYRDPTTVQLHVVTVVLPVPVELPVTEVEGQADATPPERVE